MTIAAFGFTGPITSIPHIAKGHGDVKLNRGAGGALIDFVTVYLALITFTDIVDAILI